MASKSNGTVLRSISALMSEGTVGGLTDGQLLQRFASREGNGPELAFISLVERHGPMVLRVCRTVLRNAHDAEDAFQATFLILAIKAGSIQRRQSLTSWLYSVAYNVAATARSSAARRRSHELQAGRTRSIAFVEDARDDLEEVICGELGKIPKRYRDVLVLCYLEGLTQQQAARQLGCPIGTVQSRLARGRERLRARLTQRGLNPSAAVLMSLLSSEATRVTLPARLASSTVRLALSIGAAPALPIGGSPVAVARLAERAVRSMFLNRLLTSGAAALLAAGVIATGAVVQAYQSSPRRALNRQRSTRPRRPPVPPNPRTRRWPKRAHCKPMRTHMFWSLPLSVRRSSRELSSVATASLRIGPRSRWPRRKIECSCSRAASDAT